MGKYKYLVKNVGLLAISNFSTKLLTFFLVPLYTNVLSTSDYGTFDLFSTTITLLVPILTLNIQDAIIRFLMEKDSNRTAIATIGTRCFLISNLIICFGLGINRFFGFSYLINEYGLFFFLMFLSNSLYSITSAYTRGIEYIADLSVSSVISSITCIGLNILFLLVIRIGLTGYFIANISGPIVASIYLIFKTKVFGTINLKGLYKKDLFVLLKYSVPLIATTIAWWINSASDRYVVTYFLGVAENGVYSVASKIPSILSVFQSIFEQAWLISATKEFDAEDKNGFFSKIYKSYNCLFTLLCSLLILGDKILARFLYAKNFYIAWKYVPWLAIAVLFSALAGFFGACFAAVKQTKIISYSVMTGAVLNLIMNIIFIQYLGTKGAAIATAISYYVVWIVRLVSCNKVMKFKVNLVRDIMSYIVLVCQAGFLLMLSGTKMYAVQAILVCLIMLLYKNDIKNMLNLVTKTIVKKTAC